LADTTYAVLRELSISLWNDPDVVVPELAFTAQSDEHIEQASFVSFSFDGSLACYVPSKNQLMVVNVNQISDLQLLPVRTP
jgi:hypothetical protein